MTYALLKPAATTKPTKSDVQILTATHPATLRKLLFSIPHQTLVACDTETTGTQAANPDVHPVGVGLSWVQNNETHIIYIDLPSQPNPTLEVLAEFLLSRDYFFLGFNVFFDGAILQAQLGGWTNWKYDAYGMYRQLASEGWPGQRYGLKDAQVKLLGWEDKGDVELDRWMVENCVVKNAEHVYSKWTAEERLADWASEKPSIRPDKSRMSLAPPGILGYYCGLDAYATLLLHETVLMPAIQKLPPNAQEIMEWYHSLFITEVRLLVDQQLRGIQIDLNKLTQFNIQLVDDIADLKNKFLNHPDVKTGIEEWELAKKLMHNAAAPEKYKKLPKLSAEPAKTNKKGEVSKSWAKWDIRRQNIEAMGPGEISVSWQNWSLKQPAKFNLSSGQQRRWLFYDYLGKPVKVTTKSGLPAADKKALPGLGPAGLVLNKYDKQVKLTGFIESLQNLVIGNVLHPQFNTPGTFTGRLGGSGGFNLQNIPKSALFTSAFHARPGHVWVDLDFASLENYVLAELSRDPSLLKLYGPNAPEFQDAYLFNGSQLPIIGPKIRATGYNPEAPTVESIEAAKKLAKKERQVAKVITLASNYGAGANKIRETLELENIHLSYNEAKQLHTAFWDLYGGIKEYQTYVEEEWDRRGGWVYNGIGRPICVFVDRKKDIVNRICQSTGHDILMLYIAHIYELVYHEQMEAHPVFLDTHDATCWECKTEDGPRLKQIFEQALELTNNDLMGEHGLIRLKGEAMIVHNLAESKGLV